MDQQQAHVHVIIGIVHRINAAVSSYRIVIHVQILNTVDGAVLLRDV